MLQVISITHFCINRGLPAAALFFVLSAAIASEWVVNGENGFFAKRAPQLAVAADGTPVVAFYDEKGGIRVRKKGQPSRLLNDPAAKAKPSGLALAAVGDALIAAWRERRKQGQTLVTRRSGDGGLTWDAATAVDSESRPLTRIHISGDTTKNLYIVWLGERLDEHPEPMPNEDEETGADKPRNSYHIYASRSADGGRSWDSPVKLTAGYADAIWPTLLLKEGRAYSFAAGVKGGKRHMLVRWSDGAAWSAPAPIKEVGNVLLIRPVALRDGVMVLWLAAYKGYFLLEGALSRDRGKSWRSFSVDATRPLDIANLEAAVQGEHVNIVFSARALRSGSDRKQSIYLLHSANGGRDWDELRTLRNAPSHTQALYPRIAGDGDKLAVVWNDFRNFRGGLYLDSSSDGGKSWLAADIPLTPPGRRNFFIYPFAQALEQHRGHYYLLAGRYADDSFSSAIDLVLLQFEPDKTFAGSRLRRETAAPQKTAMLRSRAEAFWKALMAQDYETAYGLFDPFFRGRFRKVDYLASTGMVKYHNFEIKDVQVEGNMGRVTLRYKYEIPTVSTRLGPLTRPPTKVKITETWLFIDGNWYKEYRSESTDAVFGRY